MVRTACRGDLTSIVGLLEEFFMDTSYVKHTEQMNMLHITKLVYAVIQQGYAWVAVKDQIVVGVLLSVREPNIWQPTKFTLRELIYSVREEYRRSPMSGRLFIEFCRTGEQLLKDGRIDGYFTTRMTTTADYDLESRGFRLTEKLYLRD